VEALRSCYYVLSNGKNLCLFPEGLRTLDGNIARFKKGFGILVKETDVNILPVAIDGAFESWPRTSKYPRRHPIKVKIGKAVTPEEAARKGMELDAEDDYEAICKGARGILMELKTP